MSIPNVSKTAVRTGSSARRLGGKSAVRTAQTKPPPVPEIRKAKNPYELPPLSCYTPQSIQKKILF